MKYHIVFLLIVLFALNVISCDDCERFDKGLREYFFETQFTGIIDSVYNNPEDRNALYIKVDYEHYYVSTYGNFSKGDSIVKKEGTLELLLYKDGFEEPIILKPKCKGREFE